MHNQTMEVRAPGSSGPVSVDDEAVRLERDAQFERLMAKAEEIRPLLRAEQAATEVRGVHSEEIHQIFWDEGFYRMLQPRRYGGLELSVPQFFQVIREIARGCPSTGWCLCLGAGHTMQLASYYGEQAQEEIFGYKGQAFGPHSRIASGVTAEQVDGGIRLSGKWRYGSSSPYSTHFFAVATLPSLETGEEEEIWAVLRRDQYTVLDDWPAGIIGMKGSGSNSLVVDDVFVPDHMVERATWVSDAFGDTKGSALHQNPMYAGTFWGFNAGEIGAVCAGVALAAVDEYATMVRETKVPYSTMTRADHPDYQRWLGLGMAQADVVSAVSVRGGQLFEEFARQSVEGTSPFTALKGRRLQAMLTTVQEVAFDAVQVLVRNASTSAVMDGQFLQRYYRDMLTITSRASSVEGSATVLGSVYLGHSAAVPALGHSTKDTHATEGTLAKASSA